MEQIATFLENNSIVVMAMFFLSLAANIIQISTYIRDKRLLKEERQERERLNKAIDTYEYLFDLAKQNIKTEEELEGVEKVIAEKSEEANKLSERLRHIEVLAQRSMVSRSIEQSIASIKESWNEIKELKDKYNSLGPLPNIPEDTKKEIESEIDLTVRHPYEFPKNFAFKAMLLIFVIFLLPWPIDTVFILVFLSLFLLMYFEAVGMYPESRIYAWSRRHYRAIGFWSALGLWYNFFNFINSLVGHPLREMFFKYVPWGYISGSIVVLAFSFAFLHWRAIKPIIVAHFDEKNA